MQVKFHDMFLENCDPLEQMSEINTIKIICFLLRCMIEEILKFKFSLSWIQATRLVSCFCKSREKLFF
jgi:hypothetical protein